jgi:hypothetical protein
VIRFSVHLEPEEPIAPTPIRNWCVSDPLPPSAGSPPHEGENKALALQALIYPSLGGDASEASEGVAHTPS